VTALKKDFGVGAGVIEGQVAMGIDESRHEGFAAQVDALNLQEVPGTVIGLCAQMGDAIPFDQDRCGLNGVTSAIDHRAVLKQIAAH
jgi:hypothetical protein